ncbi:MAG: hypothetical protein HY836_11450 [Aquabacterium sp.]|uniref:hypothetical protein n=1 Tax=Aquabacterium sp. TaxID=1872578 RepID=UPI0025B7D5E2|nr:hypothetical protein [Aquabacterium sp.]MBI5926204.1 hypothetical protein [Aquabacterium sp.]
MTHREGNGSRQHPHRLARLLCLPVIMALLHTGPAQATPDRAAQTTQTWRCTAPSGQVSYSQQPCAANGDLVTLKDARTRGQQRQATNNTERDAKLARQMQRERRHQERMAGKNRAISLSGKGGPHVIQSTPNNHDPVPISEMTKPIRIKPKKMAASAPMQTPPGSIPLAR